MNKSGFFYFIFWGYVLCNVIKCIFVILKQMKDFVSQTEVTTGSNSLRGADSFLRNKQLFS